jgi:hypothetical protein
VGVYRRCRLTARHAALGQFAVEIALVLLLVDQARAQSSPNVGFDLAQLGPEDLERTLLDNIEHIKEDRTEQDVLYELLLKLGLDLCVAIETWIPNHPRTIPRHLRTTHRNRRTRTDSGYTPSAPAC